MIGGGCIILTIFGPISFFGSSNLGRGLFAALTWLGFAAALLSGPFLTSDCLSIEKREGTLGFLFLSNLRGHDVVLGKLMATSLRAGYALLAILPVLALTITMGGITGAEYWKAALALGNALLISLAAGLLSSAISREAQKALGLTFVLLVTLTAGGPALDSLVGAVTRSQAVPLGSLSSPGYLFVASSSSGGVPFWTAFVVNQVVLAMLLGMTCVVLPRTWQEHGRTAGSSRRNWFRHWSSSASPSRSTRRRLLEANPIMWVVSRERWQARLLWLAAMMLAAAFGEFLSSRVPTPSAINPTGWVVWTTISAGIGLLIYLGVASQASRFLGDARRSGLLELLLATPLNESQIIRGQWMGLLRMFGPPLALCLILQSVGGVLVAHRTQSQISAAFAAKPIAATNSVAGAVSTNLVPLGSSPGVGSVSIVGPGTQLPPPSPWWTLAVAPALGTLTFVADLVALSWVGMWLGLTSRGVNLATLKTLLFVEVIPWLVISFLTVLSMSLVLFPLMLRKSGGPTAGAIQAMTTWMPIVMVAVNSFLSLAKDVAFVLWARDKLFGEMRDRAVVALAPVVPPVPPPIAPVSRG
ncbi:MAG TPA: hypothetical protein DCE44_19135 [Verrucomicrobiales bacterium]|nr:hypothetical protein [Verrucomicrobiales bacterium]